MSHPITQNVATMELAMHSRFAADSLLEHLDDQLETLPTDDEDGSADSEMKRAMLMTAIRSVTDSRDSNQRRLDHALKCLRRKGLYSGEFDGIVDICQDKGLTEARLNVLMVHCCIGELSFASIGGKELSDTAWQMGIELTMLQHDKKRMYSNDLYGPVLEPLIGSIYVNTVLASYVTDLSRALVAHERRIDTLDTIAQSFGGFETAFENIYNLINQIDDESSEKTKQVERTMAQQRDDMNARMDGLRKELEKARKALRPLQFRNESLEKRLKEQEWAAQAKDSRIRELEDLLDQRDRQISALSAQLEPDGELPALPDKGIVFIGGHINMVKKLEREHPEWRFIDGGDHNFTEFAPPLLVFFWDNHLSHPTWQRARRILPSDVPVVYLKSTNPEKLENEMRRGYASTVHQELPE